MIIRIIKSIISWIKDHPLGTFLGSLGIGAFGASIGIGSERQAKKINQKALSIQQEALKKHKVALNKTEEVLFSLGKDLKKIIASFEVFADTIERIHNRPKFKSFNPFNVRVRNYDPEELKQLSGELRVVLAGAGGAGVGALAGLAAFGLGVVAAAPAIIGAGGCICGKGIALKHKAVKNRKQAKQLSKDVDDIIAYYSCLRETASSFQESINTVYLVYDNHLQKLKDIVSEKTQYDNFTPQEKVLTQDTVLLARLLYEMVNTPLAIKAKGEDQLESINHTAINKIQEKSKKVLNNLSNQSFTS